MFDENVIQKLKQTDISVDAEKTKEYVKALWKTATPEDKAAIKKLAGVATATVQRIYKTGSISAKLAVPIAQTLNVSPFYLIGETDKRDECTDELLKVFLTRFGYGHLLSDKDIEGRPARSKYTRRNKIETATDEEPKPDASAQNIETPNEPITEQAAYVPEASQETKAAQETEAIKTSIDEMTEEEMIALMHSELIRAKYGADGAAERIGDLKRKLLSR